MHGVQPPPCRASVAAARAASAAPAPIDRLRRSFPRRESDVLDDAIALAGESPRGGFVLIGERSVYHSIAIPQADGNLRKRHAPGVRQARASCLIQRPPCRLTEVVIQRNSR